MDQRALAKMDAATGVTWGAWLISHVAEINEFLQTIILLLGLISASFAVYWHVKRWLRNRAD